MQCCSHVGIERIVFLAACFVVDCGGGLAYDVINTIGQAFEIRFKMFLQNPPLATEVPERFSEAIFEETEDHTYEMEYDEPKDDGQRVQVLRVTIEVILTIAVVLQCQGWKFILAYSPGRVSKHLGRVQIMDYSRLFENY